MGIGRSGDYNDWDVPMDWQRLVACAGWTTFLGRLRCGHAYLWTTGSPMR
jgi:hypothetical protein